MSDQVEDAQLVFLEDRLRERQEAGDFGAVAGLARRLERAHANSKTAPTARLLCFVYGLRDPEPRLIGDEIETRYVGITHRHPSVRRGEHVASSSDIEDVSPKALWIRSLRGALPGLVVLDSVAVRAQLRLGRWQTDGEDAVAEQRCIEKLRCRGHRLLNAQRGIGVSGDRIACFWDDAKLSDLVARIATRSGWRPVDLLKFTRRFPSGAVWAAIHHARPVADLPRACDVVSALRAARGPPR